MTPARAARRGFTLVEMLVVLVLVSLLATLLIEGTGFLVGKYAAVERLRREEGLAALGGHWFASTVGATVPSRRAGRRFAGDETAFEGVTLQPLAAESGRPTRIRWSIDEDGSRGVVYAEEGAGPWTVLASADGPLAFQYAGSSRRWQARWPPAADSRERIPRMVRLVSSGGRTLWLARFDLSPEPAPNDREEF